MFWKIFNLIQRFPILQNIRILFFFFDSIALLFIQKPKKEKEKKKVLLVFPLSLGDAIMMFGNLFIIREAYPSENYEFHIMCQNEYEELFEKVCDKVIGVDYRNASASVKTRIGFLKACRRYYYDILIDPTGMEECTPGVFTANAAVADIKIGVLSERGKRYQTPKWLMKKSFNRIIRKRESNILRTRYYAEVFSKITGKNCEAQLAKFSTEKTLNLPPRYVVVFPSASTSIKQWPVERYINLTNKFYEKYKYPIVVCGEKEDERTNQKYINGVDNSVEVINFTGGTSICQLVELIGRSYMVITNDTCIYHIAVAQNVKTVCITGVYTYSEFIDYHSEGMAGTNVKIIAHRHDCMNCDNNCRRKFKNVYPCVLENTEEEVQSAVIELMEE